MSTPAAHQAFLGGRSPSSRAPMQAAECAGHAAKNGAVASRSVWAKTILLLTLSLALMPGVESTVPFSTTWRQPHHLWNAQDQHQQAQSNQHQWWNQDLKGETWERGSRLMVSFREGEKYLTARGNTSLSPEAHPRTASFCRRRRGSSRLRLPKKLCPAGEREK